ncbi:hypothetical protein [Endozoicomonas sp. ALC020]|uniref:hypothetical protein n=1 Tax=unclassified Endozoicomonas TaxID=2644528 RepID=UPI003BB16599
MANIIIAVAVTYLYHCFSGYVSDNQTKTNETVLEVHQPVNNGAGVETLYRNSDLEKTIIKELMDLEGKTLPEDYESRLFSLSRGNIKTNALNDGELDKVNQIFDAIKGHMIELFKGRGTFDLERVQAADIEAVYIYSFSHKAATPECLTLNDICQPAKTQLITQSNNQDLILGDYKNMFSTEWILENSKGGAKYRELSPGDFLLDVDFAQKKILYENNSDFLTASRIIEKNETFPTMGFRALFVMSDPAKKEFFIQTTGRSYTHKIDAEQLSNMLKTIPGRQISMLTGLAKKLY